MLNSPFHLFTAESVYTRDQRRYADVRKRTVIRRIFEIRRNLNKYKANISILYSLVPYRLSADSKTRDPGNLEWQFCVKLCFAPVCLEL